MTDWWLAYSLIYWLTDTKLLTIICRLFQVSNERRSSWWRTSTVENCRKCSSHCRSAQYGCNWYLSFKIFLSRSNSSYLQLEYYLLDHTNQLSEWGRMISMVDHSSLCETMFSMWKQSERLLPVGLYEVWTSGAHFGYSTPNLIVPPDSRERKFFTELDSRP